MLDRLTQTIEDNIVAAGIIGGLLFIPAIQLFSYLVVELHSYLVAAGTVAL